MRFTRRDCSNERCDFRDCTGMLYSLIDMMNLARTRIILGDAAATPPPHRRHAAAHPRHPGRASKRPRRPTVSSATPSGSGWSSYSEVAAYMGGDGTGDPLPILMAGRDFGQTVLKNKPRASDALAGSWADLNEEQERSNAAEETTRRAQYSGSVEQHWPKPFE